MELQVELRFCNIHTFMGTYIHTGPYIILYCILFLAVAFSVVYTTVGSVYCVSFISGYYTFNMSYQTYVNVII